MPRLSTRQSCWFTALCGVVVLVIYFSGPGDERVALISEKDSISPAPPPPPLSPVTIWSSDFHISPIADVKQILKELPAVVIDQSFSGHCHLMKTCTTGLEPLTKANAPSLGTCPRQLKKAFFDRYRSTMEKVDAFICQYSIALCELFMPFNKSIIVHAAVRFEWGRESPVCFANLVANLQKLAADPRHIIAANSRYDVEYLRYFTGIPDIVYLPSSCGYISARYKPTEKDILVVSRPPPALVDEIRAAALRSGFNRPIHSLRERYQSYQYDDLVRHTAFIFVPYQVSIMSFFEYFTMGIPLLVPGPRLLLDWHRRYKLLFERTWATTYGGPARLSVLPVHPAARDLKYDPNDDSDEAFQWWIQLSDFYTFPHVTRFDTLAELFRLLQETDWAAMSQRILAFSEQRQKELVESWSAVLQRIRSRPGVLPPDFETAARALTGPSSDPCERCESGWKLPS